MKKIASFLMLPLLLAACGSQTAPQQTSRAPGQPALGPIQESPAVLAFEAQVQRDLAALGLTGDLSGQALAPKSYLNVLKVSDTTARAYFKTTYPGSTGCTLDWGDNLSGTVTTPTPSTMSSDQQTHAYRTSGTYVIKLTCGTDVKTSTFTAVVPVMNAGLFDTMAFAGTNLWNTKYTAVRGAYMEAGLIFQCLNDSTNMYAIQNDGVYTILPNGHKALTCYNGPNFGNSPIAYRVTAEGGQTFNVRSITGGNWNNGATPNTINAYDINDQIIGSVTFTNNAGNGQAAVEKSVNWNNVKYLTSPSSGSYSFVYIDDMSFTINTAP